MNNVTGSVKTMTGRGTMLKKSMYFIFVAAMLCFAAANAAFGQEVTGSLVGTVKDTAGAAVAGATVTAIIPSQGDKLIRTVTTNDDGIFSIPNVPTNVYTITVEAASFKKAVQTDIKVDVGQRRSVDVTLEAGSISETVTVQADQVAVETTGERPDPRSRITSSGA